MMKITIILLFSSFYRRILTIYLLYYHAMSNLTLDGLILININLVPLLQILTSAPSPSWRASVWTTLSAATCRPSTSASASRASRGTVRWSAEVSPAVHCCFYCTRINAMQHASINRSRGNGFRLVWRGWVGWELFRVF